MANQEKARIEQSPEKMDTDKVQGDGSQSGGLPKEKGGGKGPGKEPYEFSDLEQGSHYENEGNVELILDVPLEVTVELGRAKIVIGELLKWVQGSVIELPKPAGESLEIMANQRLIAKGEVVRVNERYGVRITEIVTPMERLGKLK